MLKTSPFHARTAPLVRAQTWRRWAGYQMASAYDPHPDREYAAIRNAAALIDVSPLYKYRITGRDATRLLDRTITRDMGRAFEWDQGESPMNLESDLFATYTLVEKPAK